MSGPRVVNRHHFGEGELPTPWMYIGRGTPLGNPFTVKEHGEGKALELYKKWLWQRIAERDLAVLEALSKITEAHVSSAAASPSPATATSSSRRGAWHVGRACSTTTPGASG